MNKVKKIYSMKKNIINFVGFDPSTNDKQIFIKMLDELIKECVKDKQKGNGGQDETKI